MDNRRRYKRAGIEEIDELIPFVSQGKSLKEAERKVPEEEVQNVREINDLLHDISNAIVNILLAVEALKRDQQSSDEKAKELIEIIESGTRRAAAEIKELRILCKR
jgi:signal transduction histidine kinase